MVNYQYTNYTNGWVVEVLPDNTTACESFLLLPAENLWAQWIRGLLYLVAMFYMFIGIAIASDIFMSSIEWITATKREVTYYDEERGEAVIKEVYIWNETVANLSLMALGSSAPEILIAIGEAGNKLTNIDTGTKEDSLGLFTIIGSAAFNLLIIVAICIVSVPDKEPKKIKEFGVYCFTCCTSLWAYIWMMICAVYISPHVIDWWEAWITLAFFPLMIIIAYCQDNGWWIHKCSKNKIDQSEPSSRQGESSQNVRVLSAVPHGASHVTGRELQELQKEKSIKASRVSIRSRASELSDGDRDRRTDKTKIRRAGVGALVGRRPRTAKVKMVEQANANIRIKGTAENLGRFAFSSANYSVLESDGHIHLDVLYYRKIPLPPDLGNGVQINANGTVKSDEKTEKKKKKKKDKDEEKEEQPSEKAKDPDAIAGDAVIEYETREGTGRNGHDYKHTSGKLTFKDGEYLQKITIEIMDDYQYEADKDFYVILRNPKGGKEGLGDPSVARITIIDDDEPGEFQFERAQFYGSEKSGVVPVVITRKNGCDGMVTLDMVTTDATAKGGSSLKDGTDYQTLSETITFKHGEMKKSFDIKVNKKSPPSRSFIVTIKNPSLGAKIGEHGGAVCFLGKPDDDLDGALADLIQDDDEDEDEEPGWGDQIKAAMTVEDDDDVSWVDYVLHFFTFFWKIFCALLCPPRKYLGAYPTFVMSIICCGIMTLTVDQLATLLGCVIGLKIAVTGITLVALGTSLPDTFASRTAALHDEYADNSIGNVTGSNSVNVFLGLGIPWVISTSYALAKGKQFCVTPNNLYQSVVVFSAIAALAIIILLVRRFVEGGELGGGTVSKWINGVIFVLLWVLYIVIATLKAYDILEWNPDLPTSVCNY